MSRFHSGGSRSPSLKPGEVAVRLTPSSAARVYSLGPDHLKVQVERGEDFLIVDQILTRGEAALLQDALQQFFHP